MQAEPCHICIARIGWLLINDFVCVYISVLDKCDFILFKKNMKCSLMVYTVKKWAYAL